MKIISMKCPDCHANIDVDVSGSGKYAYCQHCGKKILLVNKILLEEKSDEAAPNIEVIDANQDDVVSVKAQILKHGRKYNKAIIILALVLAIFVLFSVAILIPHQAETFRLQKLEKEIIADIKNGDYTAAEAKANDMHAKANDMQIKGVFSQEDAYKWNNTSVDLLGQISRKKSDKLNPPMTSDFAKEQDVNIVERQFRANGFVNINTVPVNSNIKDKVDKVFFGNMIEKGEVKSVTINKKSKFKKTDEFDLDAEVVIQYYPNAEDEKRNSIQVVFQ